MNHFHTVVFLALLVLPLQAATCSESSTIFDSQTLSTIFSSALEKLQYKSSFFEFVSDPTADTLKDYFLSNAAYFIPLWCMAGLALILFVAGTVQLCCYHCCGQQYCGNKMTKNTYSPCCLSFCVYLYIFFSLCLLGLAVTSFILSSDLIKETNYTICSVDNTFNELFDGTQVGVTPAWSGVDNFNQYATQIAVNFANVIPTLAGVLTSTQYNDVVSNSSGSVYNSAINFNCPSALASNTVSCPFFDTSKCQGGSSTQIPLFSSQFCSNSVNTSAASLISKEQQQNSTTWRTNLLNLSSTVLAYNTTPANFTDLQIQSAQLQDAITQFKPQLENGIQIAQDNSYEISIGIYVVLGFFLFMGLSGCIGVYCTFCHKTFGCRFILYFLWIFYMLLAVVFGAASGFMTIATFTGYDGCLSYAQISTNASSLSSLSYYPSSQVVQVLQTCFFPPANSTDTIFNSGNQQANFEQLNAIKNTYYGAIPNQYHSIVADITQQLNYYSVNPNTVTFLNANSNQNPQAALDAANVFASNGGSSTCRAVNDTLVFNPELCYPLLMNQPANDPSCILISSASSTVVADRQPSFVSRSCPSAFNTYQNNFNALNTYGQNIRTLTSLYSSNSGLSSYQSAYFSYYSSVSDLMNSQTQSLFNSFITPYIQLVQGSPCSFLTQSLNNLAQISCNKTFPFLYVLTVLTITMAIIFFIMMILSYYLSVRMEFFQFLGGDLKNYDPNGGQEKDVEIQMSPLNKQQLLADQTTNQNDTPQKMQKMIAQERADTRNLDNRRNQTQQKYNRFDERYYRTDDRYNRYEPGYYPARRNPSPRRY